MRTIWTRQRFKPPRYRTWSVFGGKTKSTSKKGLLFHHSEIISSNFSFSKPIKSLQIRISMVSLCHQPTFAHNIMEHFDDESKLLGWNLVTFLVIRLIVFKPEFRTPYCQLFLLAKFSLSKRFMCIIGNNIPSHLAWT